MNAQSGKGRYGTWHAKAAIVFAVAVAAAIMPATGAASAGASASASAGASVLLRVRDQRAAPPVACGHQGGSIENC